MVQACGSPRYGDFKYGLELILLSGSDASRCYSARKCCSHVGSLPSYFSKMLLSPLPSSECSKSLLFAVRQLPKIRIWGLML